MKFVVFKGRWPCRNVWGFLLISVLKSKMLYFKTATALFYTFLLDKFHSCKVLLKKVQTISLMFCLLKWKYVFEDKLSVLNGQTVINYLFLNAQDAFFYQNGTLNWKKCFKFQTVFYPGTFLKYNGYSWNWWNIGYIASVCILLSKTGNRAPHVKSSKFKLR